MHIHGNSMTVNAANAYSVGNAEREAAATVRKRLLKKASEADAEASPEETFLMSGWLGNQPGQHAAQQPRPNRKAEEDSITTSGRVSDFG